MTQTPMHHWMADQGMAPLTHQAALWTAWSEGQSGLLHAPTGHGKSLAALGGLLNSTITGGRLRMLWITPMRALAADLQQAFEAPVAAIKPGWSVECRTGDTGQSQRSRQRRKPPEILITTPESASLLLTYRDMLTHLAGVDTVVVDEWHELLGNKRGVQTQLLLAALRVANPSLRVWGLSATIGNLEEARDVLLGPGRDGALLAATSQKPLVIESLLPDTQDRLTWAGHLGLRLLPRIVEQITAARSTLLFTNTRSQAERWFEALACTEALDGRIALHHGSLDRSLRDAAEQGLKTGSLRCVVSTSSLDLGVDFSPVDQVIQIGSPRTLARLIQRAGRAGHQPGASSRILCVPTHTLELAEFAAARRLWASGRVEARQPPDEPIDVLLQHVVTRCLGQPQRPDALLAELRQTHAYRHLSDARWDWVLDFLGRGGEVLRAYPEYHRVRADAHGHLRVSNATVARRHRMMVGTIAADATMRLRWLKGGSLGHVEEGFISRLKPGDQFLFSGRALELVRVRELTAYVRRARRRRVAVPRWAGGRLPLSEALATAFIDWLAKPDAAPEYAALAPLLRLQQQVSSLPSHESLLVETTRSREGWHLALFPCAGQAVHEGLGACLAWLVTRQQARSITVASNDYGLELLSSKPWPDDSDWLAQLLDFGSVEDLLTEALNATELSKRQFRDVAQTAGLVFTGYPGRGKSTRQVQMSTGLLFDVFARYDPDNPLLMQASLESRRQALDWGRFQQTLTRLRRQPIRWHATESLSPFAFPLYAEAQRQQLSSESLAERLQRAAELIERRASHAA